jgi:tetratricopeptide (TPR) repeat protein
MGYLSQPGTQEKETMLIKYLMAVVISFVVVSVAMAAGGSSSSTKPKDGYYEQGVKAVKSADYKKAIKLFNKVVATKPTNADAWNYLGLSNRKLKKFDQALSAYQKALAIDPKHRGANEYLGELYLQTGEPEKARERLNKLDDICFFGCEEFDDLKAAILAYENQ